MKVLVIGGMHGNEPLGLAVVKLFQQEPVKNVGTTFGNELAIKANNRFTGQDLNRSFPGDKRSKDYEPRRAAQLLEQTKGYDIVLDFHNTHCPDNDCGFVGQTASPLLYKTAALLNLNRIIVADYDCLNKYADNCLSVEISLDSKQNNPDLWHERITMLSRLDGLESNTESIEKYRFVYRMTLEDRDRLNLPSVGLRAFEPMRKDIAEKMGIPSPAYPIFIADKYTPYNYGGVLNKQG